MTDLSSTQFLSKPEVRILLKTNNLTASRDLVLRVMVEFIFAGCSIYLFRQQHFVLAGMLFYLLSIWHSFWGYAGIGHEFAHGRVFSGRKTNYLFFYLSSFLSWSNPEFFRSSHFVHHARTFGEDDSEVKLFKWNHSTLICYILIDLPYLFRRLSYCIINSFGVTLERGSFHPIPITHRVAALFMLSFHIVSHVLIFIISYDFIYNLCWLILPFTGQFLNRILARSQHIGLDSFRNSGPLKHSRSIKLPRLLAFMYANMNYHSEHHLLPAIPYYNLPKLSTLLASACRHEVIQWDLSNVSKFKRLFN